MEKDLSQVKSIDYLQGNWESRKGQQQREQRQANYFNSFFVGQQRRPRQQQQSDSSRRKYDGPDEGPVIDVEYTTIDD